MTIEDLKVKNFDDIVSQDLPKQCIYSMIKNQKNAPKFIILSGPSGTGRKSLATTYIKSIYCSMKENLHNCGLCEECNSILDNKLVYREYDYSQIDNIEPAKFILIKNMEQCPRKDQIYLFNWWDSLEDKPTIILITETTNNIVDTIETMSLILRTNLLSDEDINKRLLKYKKEFNLSINNNYIDLITRRSRGSLQRAYKMLLNYSILDEQALRESIMSAREYFIAFLISCYKDNIDNVNKFINKLSTIPLAYLKIDYESLIVEILKVFTKTIPPKDDLITGLINESKLKVIDLYYILNDKIIYNSFQNNDTFQSAMYIIYLKLNNRL